MLARIDSRRTSATNPRPPGTVPRGEPSRGPDLTAADADLARTGAAGHALRAAFVVASLALSLLACGDDSSEGIDAAVARDATTAAIDAASDADAAGPDAASPDAASPDAAPAATCPCWTEADLAALPVETQACSIATFRIDLLDTSGTCEYSLGILRDNSKCITNRGGCPGLMDLFASVSMNAAEAATCRAQLETRCPTFIGIDP